MACLFSLLNCNPLRGMYDDFFLSTNLKVEGRDNMSDLLPEWKWAQGAINAGHQLLLLFLQAPVCICLQRMNTLRAAMKIPFIRVIDINKVTPGFRISACLSVVGEKQMLGGQRPPQIVDWESNGLYSPPSMLVSCSLACHNPGWKVSERRHR